LSLKKERKAAKKIKGRLTPSSGSIPGSAGDYSKGTLPIEHKYTNRVKWALERVVIDKIRKEAIQVGSAWWAIHVQFTHGIKGDDEVFIIPREMFEAMIDLEE